MPFARTVMFVWWEVITFNPPVIEGSTVSERLGKELVDDAGADWEEEVRNPVRDLFYF